MYSKYKLKKDVSTKLSRFNEEFIYSCGTILQDTVPYDDTYNDIITVFVKANHTCASPMEIPFYSACNYCLFSLRMQI